MRGSSRTENMHLVDVFEDWVKTQTARPPKGKHKKPVEDVYEVWIGKMVDERRKGTKTSKQSAIR